MKQYTKPSITEILIEDNATLKMWASGGLLPCVAKEAIDVATAPAGSMACGQSSESALVPVLGAVDGLFPTPASVDGYTDADLLNIRTKGWTFMAS